MFLVSQRGGGGQVKRSSGPRNTSYGPAFRQTRRHCRRPIIRAAANSASVHDAAQSWRTMANWDCSVIRVNTDGGKKHYSEERSANVRSNMWRFIPPSLPVRPMISNGRAGCIDMIKVTKFSSLGFHFARVSQMVDINLASFLMSTCIY